MSGSAGLKTPSKWRRGAVELRERTRKLQKENADLVVGLVAFIDLSMERLMKNKIGLISGFVFGLLFGFLIIIILSIIHPEEDLAGIVIITLLLSGLLFAFIGYIIQNYFEKKDKNKSAILIGNF